VTASKLYIHEFVVSSGGANGIVQYYSEANGHVAIHSWVGEFSAGDTVTGQESGFSVTLPDSFARRDEMAEPSYDTTNWVAADDGMIGIDDHFTGLPSQDYQQDHIVVSDDS
jgi:hypothetical protein